MKLTLTTKLGQMATIGVLSFDMTIDTFFSIEQAWRSNIKDISCVPAGTYDLIPYNSPKHGPTWCLHNPDLNVYGTEPVPVGGRDHCELHAANWSEQLLGCIALGEDDQPMWDPLTGKVEPAIEGSKDAIARLLEILGPMSGGHTMTITREAM